MPPTDSSSQENGSHEPFWALVAKLASQNREFDIAVGQRVTLMVDRATYSLDLSDPNSDYLIGKIELAVFGSSSAVRTPNSTPPIEELRWWGTPMPYGIIEAWMVWGFD